MVVGTFIVCWFPMAIGFFIFALKKDRTFNEEILDVFIILSHFNSAIDPLIYAYRIQDVRRVLGMLVKCKISNVALSNTIDKTTFKKSQVVKATAVK